MRLGKRNFRHRVRTGFFPYFNKRGDRIRDPFSGTIAGMNKGLPGWMCKRLMKEHRVKYLLKFADMRYRSVARTDVGQGAYVSTVCLMLNHAFYGNTDVPVIFESMLFNAPDPEDDMDCWRYASLAEARKGHNVMVKIYRKKYHTLRSNCKPEATKDED